MKTITALLFIFLLSALLLAQTDNKVWKNLEWGMSEDQILTSLKDDGVFKLDKKETYDYDGSNWYCMLGINNYIIGADQFKVRFLMNASDKLERILITYTGNVGAKSSFDSLEKLLMEKYGLPVYLKNDITDYGDYDFSRSWESGNTTIDLDYQTFKTINVEHCSVQYRPKIKTDKL